MGNQPWKSLLVFSMFFLSLKEIRVSFADPQVPCLFIFGDSLSDNGNNNNRLTIAKPIFPPYGIDFPNYVPTGRATNGLNLPDFIAQLLGFQRFIPPYATAPGQDIVKGVNYASSAAGIRDDTGRNAGDIISLRQQIENHGRVINRINNLMGSINATEELLKKYIYYVNMGSNDYLNNYYLPPISLTRLSFTSERYAIDLVQKLKSRLPDLYRDGARKFLVFGVGVIGCTPVAMTYYGSTSSGSLCVDEINNAANLFNARLKSLIIDLNANLSGVTFTFTFVNTSSFFPADKFIVDRPCCRLELARIACIPFSTPCPDRSKYFFFDGVHPTSAVYSAAALEAYQPTNPNTVFPFSISQLALL